MRSILFCVAFFLAGGASAEAPPVIAAPVIAAPVVAAPDNPDTEIFLGRYAATATGRAASGFSRVTNHKGYDNQPWFIPGEAAFYYVAADDAGKTDLYRYDLGAGAGAPVFSSAGESEYSPRRAPDGGVSYIQENPAGDVTRVHRRTTGADQGAAVVDFAPVGYYAWLDGGKALAVYYRTEPGSLYRVDVASGGTTLLHEKIGRPLHANAKGDLLWFAAIDEAGAFQLARYDVKSGATAILFALPGGAEDITIEFDTSGAAVGALSASGTTLYWRGLDEAAGDWAPIADLSSLAILKASRVAVDPVNGLVAVVGEVAQ